MNKKYLGGLYDGDGSIMICKCNNDGYTLIVSLWQCYPKLQFELQKHYGGIIYKCKEPESENVRQGYYYVIRGKNCEKILNDLEEGCIIKYPQVALAKRFFPLIKKNGKSKEREEIRNKIQALNRREDYEDRPYDRVDLDYISGLFDAEGSISIGKIKHEGMRVKITQRNDNNILYFIRDFFNLGEVDGDIWVVYDGKSMYEYLKEMDKNLIVKKEQMNCLLKLIESIRENKRAKYGDELHQYRDKLYQIIQKEKHESIDIDVEEIDKINKEIKNELLEERKRKKEEQKKINKEIWRKKISEAKMGAKNPNFGKEFSEDHAKKIALSNIGKSRKLSDDDIRYIIANKNEMKQQDLANKYGVSRQYVAKIFKGLILPLSEKEEQIKNNRERMLKIKEEKDENFGEYSEFSKRKSAINKRRLTAQQMLEIVKLKGKKIPSTKINNYINFKDRDGNLITQDMVKNLWKGRTRIFEEEFKNLDMTYEDYLEIIGK